MLHRLSQGYAVELLPSGDACLIHVTRAGEPVAQLLVSPTQHGSLNLVIEAGDQTLVDLTLTEGPGVEGALVSG